MYTMSASVKKDGNIDPSFPRAFGQEGLPLVTATGYQL